MKLTVMLGYWEGDKKQAMEVAKLLSDLLPEKSSVASLFFCHRHDCSPPDDAILKYCAAKFAYVGSKRSSIQGKGFPGGCNAIAYSIVRYVRDNTLFDGTECFLILESDCVITRRSWDTELLADFRKAKSMGKLISGHIMPFADRWGQHVNAVALYDRFIGKTIKHLGKGTLQVGWDYTYGYLTAPVAYDTPLIYLDYRKPTITREELFAPRKEHQPVLLFHGVKDNSAITAVRKEYNL